jgi:hypothetical protein
MADNNEDKSYSPEEPFNFGPMVAPLQALGVDPRDVRANPQLFAKLAGGGVGLPSENTPAAPTTGAVPPSASRTGRATPDVARAALSQAVDAMANAPDSNVELGKEKELQDKLQAAQKLRSQNLRDEKGDLLPQYKPSIGRKILRGVEGAVEGFGLGGIPGAIRGAVAPQIYPGRRAYGAPNNAGEQELRRENSDVASTQQSLGELRNRFKEAQEAAYGRARELTGIGTLAKDTAAKPDATKEVVDRKTGAVRFVSADEANSGDYVSPTTYNSENKADKAPTNYEQTVIAAENESDPNGPMHRAAQKMRDTEIRKFKASNGGRAPTDLELWRQAFKTQYNRDPNSEEIASRHVSGGGTAGGAAGKAGKGKDRQSFENGWNTQFNVMERKYDARKTAVNKDTSLGDEEKQAQIASIEAERESEKLRLQTEKDKEADQYGIYNQPASSAAAPAAATQTGRPQPSTSQPKQLDEATARAILKEAGGDKNKARQLAKQRNYKF